MQQPKDKSGKKHSPEFASSRMTNAAGDCPSETRSWQQENTRNIVWHLGNSMQEEGHENIFYGHQHAPLSLWIVTWAHSNILRQFYKGAGRESSGAALAFSHTASPGKTVPEDVQISVCVWKQLQIIGQLFVIIGQFLNVASVAFILRAWHPVWVSHRLASHQYNDTVTFGQKIKPNSPYIFPVLSENLSACF